jgi:hypothetical protein
MFLTKSKEIQNKKRGEKLTTLFKLTSLFVVSFRVRKKVYFKYISPIVVL